MSLINIHVIIELYEPWEVYTKSVCRYGRKRILWTATLFLVYFGLMTSFVPSYYWLLAVRFCVGACLSVLIQSVTYLSEFLPIRSRSSSILLLEVAWSAGSGLVCLLGILVLHSLGWRYMVALTSVPGLIVLFFFPTVPVSPRYLLASNEVSAAERVLASAAKQNCRALPPGELVLTKARSDNVSIGMSQEIPTEQQPNLKKKGNLLELFSSEYRVTTLLLMAIWIVVGFCYFGAVLLSIELFQYDTHCAIRDNSNTTTTITTAEYKCKVLTNQDLVYSLLISLGEFPGIILSLVLNDTVGRKLSMVFQLILASILYGLLSLCAGTNDKIVKTVFLFIIRASTGGCIQSLYLYTPEAYPTRIRSSALAFHSLMSRVGSIVTSFTATALLVFNFYATIAIYAVASFVTAILVFLLPYETKGTQLGDNSSKRRFLC